MPPHIKIGGSKRELPMVMFGDMIAGMSDPPKEFEIVTWESGIPPYKSYVNLATYFDEDNTSQNKTESEMQKCKETTYYRNAVRVCVHNVGGEPSHFQRGYPQRPSPIRFLDSQYTRTIGKRYSFVGFFMFVGADVHISNYVHRVADEHKVPQPPRRPTGLCSSADVSARRT
jgi:hypothetical protein